MALRCPACGRRVLAACPEHGTIDAGELEAPPLANEALPRFAGYEVRRVIARGGFATVFEADREVLAEGDEPTTVAIKVPRADRPEAPLGLAQEARVLAEVGPPHVPAVLGGGALPDGCPYLVMEYLAAPTLADRLIAAREPIPLGRACAYALAILRALEPVHARGYVHRDLKPENVFIDDTPRATLVDFGLVMSAAPASGNEETASARVGTAEYMSPEQCEGRADLDARADLYALGVILYELIAGRPPFWGSRTVVHESHLSRRPPRLEAVASRAVPRPLEELVSRCLAKDRRSRFESAAAVRAALVEACAALPEDPPSAAEATTGGGASVRASAPPSEPRPARIGDRSERLTVGLLFFETAFDVVEVQARLLSLGGQLAYAAEGRYVVAHGQEPGENPARRAFRAAEEMLRQGLCERVRLDLAPVAVQIRRDGSKRLLSPLLGRRDRFPPALAAPGISLTPAAAEVLRDLPSADEAVAARPAIPTPAPARLGETDLSAEMMVWPLIGREAELDALVKGALQAAREALPTITTVFADGGQGKTHLYRVLVKRLQDLGVAEVIAIRAREPALGDADHTLAELLARALDLPLTAPADGGRALLRERLEPHAGADLAPAVALALGWVVLDAPRPAMQRGLRRLGAAPGALRSALKVAAGEALRRRAGARPLFVIIDDAHFAGDVVLSALEYAALAEARVPIWVCALGRAPLEDDRPSWGERAGRRETFRLGPLDPSSAAALCRMLLLPVLSVPDAAVQRLVERAQAIPLLLVELVRGLRREGILRRSPKGQSWYLATDELDRLPDLPLLEWLARSELEALAPALRGHARVIALLGERVTLADVDGIVGRLEQRGDDTQLPLDPRIATRRLFAAGMMLRDPDGYLTFRHALVREAIAQATTGSLRQRVHLAAALHYQAGGGGISEERRLAQLAFHGSVAGMGTAAVSAYLVLADRARNRHAYTEAERLYSRALEQREGALEVDRGAAYRGRGLMRYRIGRYHDALADFSCAREMAVADGDVPTQIEILLDEATALDWMDDFKSSEERVAEARALIAEVSSPVLEARCLLGIGRSAHRFSRNEEAATLLAEAAAAAEPLGDDGYETWVISLVLLGYILPGLGRLDEALAVLDRAIGPCEAHGDHLHLGGAIDHRAMIWACLGEKERMMADFNRSLILARELGQGTLELVVEYNTGEMLLLMDDGEAAEPHIRNMRALDRKISGDPGRPVVAALEGRLAFYRGDEDTTRAIVERIRAHQEAARARDEANPLMVPSEEVLCAMLDLATRPAEPAEWDELEARSERSSVGQERIEVIETRAIALARRGQHREAREILARALNLAARIPNAMGGRLRRRLAELPPGDGAA
jgi:serine/threonine protein kinase/tetratricopeptide (TPR) repeat protein